MYRSSPFRHSLNTGYITGFDMCRVCTEAVHSVTLWTRVTSQVWTCVEYVPKQSIPWHFEHGLHHSMYRSSPFRHTLNTGYITGFDMCRVCTEAVHSVTLWTRVTSQVWTCVTYVYTENGFAWQAQYICNVYMKTPCACSEKTLKKCRKTWR